MRFGSVCSGIEAASVAWPDWQCAFVSEIDKFPCALLAHHYPDVPNFGDMTNFKEWPDERIDVLVGGTPCQSFSVAGLRKGLADQRGNLTLTYLAIAAKYRPEWLVWENVPGILSDRTGAFGAFLGGLGELGYGFAYRILDAQHFGVPQRRRRVFVVGCLGDWRRAAAVLFERHSLQGHPAPSREAPERVALPITSRVDRGGEHREAKGNNLICADVSSVDAKNNADHGDSQHLDRLIVHAPEISRCIATREGTSQDWETTAMVAHSLRADGFDASEDGTGRGTPLVPICFSAKDHGADAGDISPTLRAGGFTSSHANAGVMPAIAFAQNQRDEVRAVAGALAAEPGMKQQTYLATGFQSSQSGVRQVDAHATLDGNNGSRRHNGVMQGMQVRRLTPRECERLQGFRDDYTLIPYPRLLAKDGPRYKALGNSMAVPCMIWIGQRIKMVQEIVDAKNSRANARG